MKIKQRYNQHRKDCLEETNTFESNVELEESYDEEINHWNGKSPSTDIWALKLLFMFGLL